MAKKKTEPGLKNWDDVDGAIRWIGELDINLQKIEGNLNEEINTLKEVAKNGAAVLIDIRDRLTAQVEEFCEERKAEFLERRSRKLIFGTVAFRVTESIRIRTS